MLLSRIYKRWRHTRGYGVHSPFAYMIVKEVIKPSRRYAWYAYEDMETLLPSGDSRLRKEARMFFRLLAILRPSSICFYDSFHVAFRCAAIDANPGIGISKYDSAEKKIPEADMLATVREAIPADLLCRFVSLPSKTLMAKNIPEELRLKILDAMPGGVMFYGRHNIICISRPEMQKVVYSIRI